MNKKNFVFFMVLFIMVLFVGCDNGTTSGIGKEDEYKVPDPNPRDHNKFVGFVTLTDIPEEYFGKYITIQLCINPNYPAAAFLTYEKMESTETHPVCFFTKIAKDIITAPLYKSWESNMELNPNGTYIEEYKTCMAIIILNKECYTSLKLDDIRGNRKNFTSITFVNNKATLSWNELAGPWF